MTSGTSANVLFPSRPVLLVDDEPQALQSFETALRSFGINNLLSVIFRLGGATNGYDQYGHYVRARLVLTTCTTYATQNQISCNANFTRTSAP